MEDLVIIRYSEIAVKGPSTRTRMESLLASNIEDAIATNNLGGSVRILEGRIIIEDPKPDAQSVSKIASRVFGVKSASPAIKVSFSDLDDLSRKALEYFADKVKGKIFRVRARRAGKHSFTSKDVERVVGKLLLDSGARGVDLENPEYTAYIEVRGRHAYFYDVVIPGPGGLPLGSEDPVLVLYSGGFDSTVTAWFVMRRGSPVHLIYYDLGHPGALEIAYEAARLLARLWSYGHNPRMIIADFTRIASLVRERVRPEYRTLVLRRLMAMHATRVAESLGINALATGENIGQVATQTIINMYLIWRDIPLPVLRPVSGMDKDEITALAREIGVYDIISKQIEVCGRDSAPTPRGDPGTFDEEFSKIANAAEKLDVDIHVRELK
ncbi:MAG: tRNA sulfurtransferase [Desulfurococcales archaeon]|nr:tRNA sulfurtransferase [Desulfurococcales archaeon]